ncbi:ANO8 [Bugula neritina]|uniref:ANO8 n=1 Tax=Bugula neritina TaxID=10212 RepID=A0A7J7K6U2_BUGNE|nr:ANO8 [Bugula neritina]
MTANEPVSRSDQLTGDGGTDGLRKRISNVTSKLKSFSSWSHDVCNSSCIPSSCDVVIQFPKDAPPYIIKWLNYTISSLESSITIQVCKHESTGLTNLLCSASFHGLMKGAEELSLKKQLKQKYGGQLKDFFLEDAGMYQDVEDTELFFTSEERQHILLIC